jgi:hypothetical protein
MPLTTRCRGTWCWRLALLPLLILSQPAPAQDLQALKDAIEDHYAAGRYPEAETEAKQLLPLLERRYGATHEAVMEVMDRLAWTLYRERRYQEAAQLHRRVIDVRRKSLGDRHALVARSIDGLARALWELGRKEESKALSKQGIAALPPGFTLPGAAETIQRNAAAERQAADLAAKGKLGEAERLYRDAAGTHKDVVLPAEEELANLLLRQGRDAQAFQIHQRMIAVWRSQEKGFYGSHIFASNLTRLARQYEVHGKLDKEALFLEMATAVRERTLGATHPETLAGLADLGRSYERQGRKREAFHAYSRVADAERTRLAADAPDRAAAQSASLRYAVFGSLVRTAYALAAEDASESAALSRQAFEAAQWATISRAGAALSQMSARFAAGSGPLAQLVRERQDSQQQWQLLDRQLIDALGAPSAPDAEARLASLRANLASAEKRIAELDATLRKAHARYADLSNPRPFALDAVQPLLRPDEALYVVFPIQEYTYSWVVTRAALRWIRIPMGDAALAQRVHDLRCGLDRDGEWEWSAARKRWFGRTPPCARLHPEGLIEGEPPPFNLAAAHELYQLLFGQVRELISGKHLLLVLSGPLEKIPLDVDQAR